MMKKQITNISIEHIVITSNKSFEQVKTSLEQKIGEIGDTSEIIKQLQESKIPWEQAMRVIQERLGTCDFVIFNKIEHSSLLALAGKNKKGIQYTIGNPLFAIQMTQHVLAAALYAPFKLLLYEEDKDRTFITYDSLASLTSHFHNEEVSRIAQLIDQKLENILSTLI